MMWQRLLPNFIESLGNKTKLNILALMKSKTFQNPRSHHNMLIQLRDQIKKGRLKQALERLINAKNMTKLMRNIRHRSCANLMRLIIEKQSSRCSRAFGNLMKNSKGPESKI